MSKEDYVITNMVASVNLGIDLDLYELTSQMKNIEYEPEQFPGAIMKLSNPKATILVFKNGKIVIVGCRDKKTIEAVIKEVYKRLLKFGKVKEKYDVKHPKYMLTNMVASSDLHMDLDLFSLAFQLEDIEYEPEQFPGAIIRLRNPDASLLLFKNGKIIIAGCRNRKDIEKSIKKIKEKLKQFR